MVIFLLLLVFQNVVIVFIGLETQKNNKIYKRFSMLKSLVKVKKEFKAALELTILLGMKGKEAIEVAGEETFKATGINPVETFLKVYLEKKNEHIKTKTTNIVWEKIIELLRSEGSLLPKQISDLTGLNRSTVRSSLSRMGKTGILGRDLKGEWFYFAG